MVEGGIVEEADVVDALLVLAVEHVVGRHIVDEGVGGLGADDVEAVADSMDRDVVEDMVMWGEGSVVRD